MPAVYQRLRCDYDMIEKESKAFYTPDEVARIIGCAPQMLRIQARMAPEKLGFPVCVMGRRVRIPKIPFNNFILDRGVVNERAASSCV